MTYRDSKTLWETLLTIVERHTDGASRSEILDALEALEGYRREKISGYLKKLCLEGFLRRSKEDCFATGKKYWVFYRTSKQVQYNEQEVA